MNLNVFYILTLIIGIINLFVVCTCQNYKIPTITLVTFLILSGFCLYAKAKPYTYPITPTETIYLSDADSSVCIKDEDFYYFKTADGTLQKLFITRIALYETYDKSRIEVYKGTKTFLGMSSTSTRYKVYLPVGSFIEGNIVDISK